MTTVCEVSTVTTMAGSGLYGHTDSTGKPLMSAFCQPSGCAFDASDGSILVCDHSNHAIRKILPGGQGVVTVAGSGAPGLADGSGACARFCFPSGIAACPDGTFAITDHGNNRCVVALSAPAASARGPRLATGI